MRTRIVIEPGRRGPRIELRGDVLTPRILSAGPRGSAQIALVATQMLLLAGDDIGIDVLVGTGCTLEIVEPVGTVAYGGEGESRWGISIEIADGGTLIWQGQPFVISDDARVRRSTRVTLGEGARLLQREVLAFGRSGQQGGDLASEFHAYSSRMGAALPVDGHHPEGPRHRCAPLLIEDLDLSHGRRGRVGVLGETRVLDSIIALGWRPEAEASAGVTAFELAEPGTLLRQLGREHTHQQMDTCWRAWHGELSGLGCAQPLRALSFDT